MYGAFSHILNLVILDTCNICLETKMFLGDIQALKKYTKARKRTTTYFIKLFKNMCIKTNLNDN